MTESQQKRLDYLRDQLQPKETRRAMHKHADRLEKIYNGRGSLAYRIAVWCRECYGMSQKARECTTDTCPLFGGRPEGWTGARIKRPATAEQIQRGKALQARRAQNHPQEPEPQQQAPEEESPF